MKKDCTAALLQFYDHHMRLAAAFHGVYEHWRQKHIHFKCEKACAAADFYAKRSAEEYEIADGARRVIDSATVA